MIDNMTDDDELTAEELLGQSAEVWKRRALEAERKLSALAEAAEAVLKYREPGPPLGAWGDLVVALRTNNPTRPPADNAIAALVAHVDSLTVRLAAAEQERDAARLDLDSEKMARYGREMTAMEDADASRKRAEAAEAKLAALVQAWENGRPLAKLLAHLWKSDHDTQRARADAAETKLAALVQACDSDDVTRTASNEVRAAIQAARGEP